MGFLFDFVYSIFGSKLSLKFTHIFFMALILNKYIRVVALFDGLSSHHVMHLHYRIDLQNILNRKFSVVFFSLFVNSASTNFNTHTRITCSSSQTNATKCINNSILFSFCFYPFVLSRTYTEKNVNEVL